MLAEKCQDNNIKLFNCSTKTIINEVPRLELNDALKGELI